VQSIGFIAARLQKLKVCDFSKHFFMRAAPQWYKQLYSPIPTFAAYFGSLRAEVMELQLSKYPLLHNQTTQQWDRCSTYPEMLQSSSDIRWVWQRF
jgi:hypothetical protein